MVVETRPLADSPLSSPTSAELSRLLADSYAWYTNLVTERIEAHQKALWMLRSTVDQS